MLVQTKGLGDVNQIATGGGSAIGGGLFTAGAIAGGPTNPVGIGLMIAGAATMLGTALLGVFGVGKRNPFEDKDVQTLNQLQSDLQTNLDGWNSGTKTSTEQQQRIAIANSYLSQMGQLCSDPNLPTDWATGCIKDRVRGGKFDWYASYLDPIVNASPSDAGALTSFSSLLGGNNILYLGGAAIVIGLLMAKD